MVFGNKVPQQLRLEGHGPEDPTEEHSVIGSVEEAPAGNCILRVGRSAGGPWHQTEHVTLRPSETLDLCAEMLARVGAHGIDSNNLRREAQQKREHEDRIAKQRLRSADAEAA